MSLLYAPMLLAIVFTLEHCNAWENKWIYTARTPTQQADDTKNAAQYDDRFNKRRQDEFKKNEDLAPFHTPVKWDDRMVPLCRLHIVAATQSASCSCAFVKTNLVATALHCFADVGVTQNSGHRVYVQREYGKNGHASAFSSYPKLMALEWWLPNLNDVAEVDKPSRDIAFVKVADDASRKTYKLTSRDNPMFFRMGVKLFKDTKVMAVGYPYIAHASEEAVSITGELKSLATGQYTIQSTARGTAKFPKVSLGEGGSGGPWLIDTQELAIYESLGQGVKELYEFLKWMQLGIHVTGSKASSFVGLACEATEKLIKAVDHMSTKGLAGATDVKDLANGSKEVTLPI